MLLHQDKHNLPGDLVAVRPEVRWNATHCNAMRINMICIYVLSFLNPPVNAPQWSCLLQCSCQGRQRQI